MVVGKTRVVGGVSGVDLCDGDLFVVFFFFKQKTAYEIYQCDWSSDVCSSDLVYVESPQTAECLSFYVSFLWHEPLDDPRRFANLPDRKSVV